MKTLLCALLLSLPAWGVVAHGGSCSGTTACTPSSSAPFQLEIAFASRASATPASLPAGWVQIVAPTRTSGSMLVACRVEYTSTPAASGTFTNAANVGIVSYTGTGARSNADCPTAGLAGVGTTGTSNGSSTTVSYGGITLKDTGNHSWVIGAQYGAGSNTCAPSGMTKVTGASTATVQVNDTNATVSSWSTTTCAITSSIWITAVVEIMIPPANPPTISQLVNSWCCSLFNNVGHGSNPFRIAMDATGAGNGLLVPMVYTSTATVSSVQDDQGDSASPIGSTCTDAGNGVKFAWYYFQNLTAGARYVVVTFSGNISMFTMGRLQVSGVLTSTTPNDGTPSCTADVAPANNAIGNLADPTGVTTASNGDLVVGAWFDGAAMQLGVGGNTTNDVVWGSGFTGIYADMNFGFHMQAEIQASSGLIKPSMTVVQTGGHSNFIGGTIALKTSAGAGTARQSGKIIREMTSVAQTTGNPWFFTFPCDTGNMIVWGQEAGPTSNAPTFSGAADTAGNTFGAGINTGGGLYGRLFVSNTTGGAVCNGQDFVAVTGTNGAGLQTYTAFYEVPNAAISSNVDTAASASASFSNSAALTTLGGSGITSAIQTNLALAAGGGITTNEYLMLSTEIVQCTSGCGSTSIIVSRGQLDTAALSSVASGTNVKASLAASIPSVTTTGNNEVIFATMNQGAGPNWGTLNCTYDLMSTPGAIDGDTALANGDGFCHQYMPSSGTNAVGWYAANQDTGTSGQGNAIAIILATVSNRVITSAFPFQGIP